MAKEQSEDIVDRVSATTSISLKQVSSAVSLLDADNSLPFIARYRKEVTGGLDEKQLRQIVDSLQYERELAARKTSILRSIEEQGKLSESLRQQIVDCDDKKTLEAIYAPYKKKRKNRADVAKEAGLEPLAAILYKQQPLTETRQSLLKKYIAPEKGIETSQAALDGACDIVAQWWSEDANAQKWIFKQSRYCRIVSKVKRGKSDPNSKFAAYFDHQELLEKIASHRFLALKRGESEGILSISILWDEEDICQYLQRLWVTNDRFEFKPELKRTVIDAVQRLVLPSIDSALMLEAKERADDEAIEVFADNVRSILLSPPAGAHTTIGIDPGFRTGCKVAVVDETGTYVDSATIYPTPPRNELQRSSETLVNLIDKHQAKLIAIGNGTASRETDLFVSKLIKENQLSLTKVVVSETGASIYSASELAASEYPNLDVTVRGAISIAHRLQDPLAELVKIDPKSIGVGQYQHDVNQVKLRTALDREVQSCVSLVGVDLNLASAALLSHVGGIGPKLADSIVAYRDANGKFKARTALKKVPKLGPKAFQQAAGFLRIRNGTTPLDQSAVHPESYPIVEAMAGKLDCSTRSLIGDSTLAAKINPSEFVSERVGLPTIVDILAELKKPGRDPREQFTAPTFDDAVQELEDLKVGMKLQGSVTNVTKFGAFVDIGVHQDGLIHISELANRFVADPKEIVHVGEVVTVQVIEIDLNRKRIALSKKALEAPADR